MLDESILLGLAYFATVKFVGYSYAASYIKRRIPGSSASPWFVGGVRTVVGFAVAFGLAIVVSQFECTCLRVVLYALLAPVRFCEWLILLWLFFRRGWDRSRSFKLAGLGTLWSYVTDIPIMAIFVTAGGAASGTHKLTLFQLMLERGVFAWPHVYVFFALIIFFGSIHTKKLGSRYRYATILLAFVPFLIGIAGFLCSYIGSSNTGFACVYGIQTVVFEFYRYAIMPMMAAIETVILLLISSALLITNRDTPDQS